MPFIKGNPPEGVIANQINDQIRANNESLENSIEFGHEFVTGSATGEHREGSAVIYSGNTAPSTKEDGSTVLDANDIGRRLWRDESVTPNELKIMASHGPVVFTSIAQFIGMLDEDDMNSDSNLVPATQQSIKKFVDDGQALDVKLAGSTMTGALDMGSNLINGVTDPSSAQDAATKAYVDANRARTATGTLAGSDTETRTAVLAFTPSFVMVSNDGSGDNGAYVWMAGFGDTNKNMKDGVTASSNPRVKVSGTTLTFVHDLQGGNNSGSDFTFFASEATATVTIS